MSTELNDIRARLADLGGMADRQKADDRVIRRQAEDRINSIGKTLDDLRPLVASDKEAAHQYSELTLERGELQRTLAALGSAE